MLGLFPVIIVAVGKAIIITYSECVFVACIIQTTKRIRCIILTSVNFSAALYFPTLPYKGHDFRGKNC
jgi:hypothetical protein